MAEENKKLSVAEILAAARKGTAAGAPAPASEKPAAEAAPAAESAAASEPVAAAAEAPAEVKAKPKPAAKPAAAGSGGKLSVAEMLAMARAGGAKSEAAKPAAEAKPVEKAAPKPAPKPAAEKASPKAPAKTNGDAVKEIESASILSGGAKKVKAGPISKAEAAAALKEAVAPKPAKTKPVAPPMPAKPEFAKPKAKGKADETDRRGFIGIMLGTLMGIGFTAMGATFSLWGLATARFMFPNVLREPPSRFKVGFKSDFPPGKVEEKYKAQFGVWVVNWEYNGQQQIYALSTVCTHLGCTPNWLEAEQKYKCPCHGSGFYKDGINFEGPAPRPLERYAIRIADDGQLEIDKSRKFQEEMGQWEDAASYVNV